MTWYKTNSYFILKGHYSDITSIKLFNGALPMARHPRGRQLRGAAQPCAAHLQGAHTLPAPPR